MKPSFWAQYADERFLRKIASAVILLALAGLATSTYLAVKHYTQDPFGACPVFKGGCDIVNQSEYSMLFGIPLAVYGMAFYLGLVFLGNLYLFLGKNIYVYLAALGSLFGFLASMIFVAIQGFLIGAFCFYCELSATISTILFLITAPLLFPKKIKGALQISSEDV